jgi:predicted phage-related endonuclease
MKTTHALKQGSPEWDQFRLEHFGASEAGAMLGESLTTNRTELLHAKATGIAKEFSRFVREKVLDYGHEVEALARPHVEALIGEDLYPVTCSDGVLSASCDGLTMAEDIAFEHKQWSERIAAMVKAGEVPPEHMPQCQQVLMVTGAEKLIFVVSDGTPDKMVYVWALPDPEWFDRLRAGWAQFAEELAAYVPPEPEAPKAIGRTMESLPALLVSVRGEVTESNLAEYKAHAFEVLGSVNRELETDQDFADARKAIKWCGDVEARIATGKEDILARMQTIDAVFRVMDEVSAETKRIRLELDGLVTTRDRQIKENMIFQAKAAYQGHLAACQQITGGHWIQLPSPDFAGAIKGKRSLVLMQDAINTTLANGKIAADTSGRNITAALACIATDGAGYEFLFNDRQALIAKPLDDLKMLVAARITQHKAAVAAEEEKTRERIRKEEEARAEAAMREKLIVAERQAQEGIAAARDAETLPAPLLDDMSKLAADVLADAVSGIDARRVISTVSQASAEPPTLRLGVICERLPCTVTAADLAAMGIQPAGKDRAAVLYRESQWPAICDALIARIREARELVAA